MIWLMRLHEVTQVTPGVSSMQQDRLKHEGVGKKHRYFSRCCPVSVSSIRKALRAASILFSSERREGYISR